MALGRRTTRPFRTTNEELPQEDQLPAPSRVLVDGLWEKFGGMQSGVSPTNPGSMAEQALYEAAYQQGREEVLNFLTDLANSSTRV